MRSDDYQRWYTAALSKQPPLMLGTARLCIEGWKSDDLDDYFEEQRACAVNPEYWQQQGWFSLARKVMSAIDHAANVVPAQGRFSFLDMG